MSILGLKERDGSWYLIEYDVISKEGTTQSIGRSEWADWAPNGDLLFAQSGRLYRLRCVKGVLGPIETSEVIADFSDLAFENKEASDQATVWPLKKAKVKKR